MTPPKIVKMFDVKSHQRRDLYLYPARNGRSKTGSGSGRHPPPVLIRFYLEGLVDKFIN